MKHAVIATGALLLMMGGLTTGQTLDSELPPSTKQQRVPGSVDQRRAVATSSDYIGHDVINSSGQTLGEIVDLAIEGSQGRVIYAVLASGGLFGIGQNLFAVPIGAFARDGAGDALMFDISRALLDEKDAFDADHWPTQANQSLVEATTAEPQRRPRQSAPADSTNNKRP